MQLKRRYYLSTQRSYTPTTWFHRYRWGIREFGQPDRCNNRRISRNHLGISRLESESNVTEQFRGYPIKDNKNATSSNPSYFRYPGRIFCLCPVGSWSSRKLGPPTTNILSGKQLTLTTLGNFQYPTTGSPIGVRTAVVRLACT